MPENGDSSRERGSLEDTPRVYGGLEELVAEKKPGRENPDERTITVKSGLAIKHRAVASPIYGKAVDKGIGIWLPL